MTPIAFAASSMHHLFEASAGVPGAVNEICSRALELGVQEQAPQITPELMLKAISDLSPNAGKTEVQAGN